MPSKRNAFSLNRANEADSLAIATVLFHSFDQFALDNYFGVATRDELFRLADKYSKVMVADAADIWIIIKDAASDDMIVAVSNWKLYLAPETAIPRVKDEPAPWLSGEAVEKQRLLLEPMNEARARANSGPFMYLHILATHPDYRRQGLGAMMMQWGVDVADSLCLPGWIEASPEGNFLYRRYGFENYEEIRRDDELLGRAGEVLGMTMRRPARQSPLTAHGTLGTQ